VLTTCAREKREASDEVEVEVIAWTWLWKLLRMIMMDVADPVDTVVCNPLFLATGMAEVLQ
jgi:hypothetical protein